MKTKPFYLVIDTETRTAKRVTQRWPSLYSNEIVARFQLDVPDHVIPLGVPYQLVLDDPSAIAVAVDPVAVEPPEDGDDLEDAA